MPRTLTFPSPSPHVCPVCDVRLAAVPCVECGADLRLDEGAEIARIDRELHRLAVIRGVLVERLLAPTFRSADHLPPPPVAHPERPPSSGQPVPPPPTAPGPATVGGGQGPSRWSVAEILVGLGGLSLVAAVVVFAAVAWSDLAAWAQGGLLLAATGAVVAAAVACRRRSLGATAESLGVVALALGLADVEVAHTALDGLFSTRTVWSVGLATVATGAISIGRRIGLRGLAAGGVAAAFIPLPLLAAGAESTSLLAWALGCQALGAVALMAVARPRVLDRPVLTVGASISWALAAATALTGAVNALIDASAAVPVADSVALLVLAGTSVALGVVAGSRPLALAGMLLAFVPGVLLAVGFGTLSWVAAALVIQCALGLVAGHAADRSSDRVRAAALGDAAHVGAAVSAVAGAATGVVLGVDAMWADSGPSAAAVATVVAVAAVSVAGAVLADWGRNTRAVTLIGAVVALLAAVAFAATEADGGTTVTLLMGTGGVLAVGCAALARVDRHQPWTAPLTAAAGAVGALALIPLATVGAVGLALAEVSVPPVEAGVTTSITDQLAAAPSVATSDLPSALTIAQLASAAQVGVAGLVLRRRWAPSVLAAAVVATLLAAPVVAAASIGVTALLLAGGVVAATWRLSTHRDDAAGIAGLAALSALLLAVGAASAPLLMAATLLVTAALALLASRALIAAAPSAPLWVSVALVSGLGGLTIDALRLGSVRSGPAIAVGLAAAAASVVGPAIERWFRDDDTGAAVCADIVTGAALVIAVFATRSVDAASALVALVGLVAGAHALRPTRRPLVGIAIGSSVVLTWMRLFAADVATIEAYTLPLAGALLVAGAAVRPDQHTSWVRNGAGLAAAIVPTTVLAVLDGDLVRTSAAVLFGAAVAIFGAIQREQAPVAIGAAALSALAIRHLGPVADELPRYVVFAVAGVALLATGATFEQRRRDLRRARDAFAELR